MSSILKITALPNEKPVKLTVELPASVHRDLLAYAQLIVPQTGKAEQELANLIVAMVTRFMATDRAFLKKRRTSDRG
ncbi:DUF2274 domain-containing protein [Bradyrhizobium sp. USDA 4353]